MQIIRDSKGRRTVERNMKDIIGFPSASSFPDGKLEAAAEKLK